MERRSFIRNIFGTVVGLAIYPTAIREFAESVPISENRSEFFVNIDPFRVGDIIALPDGRQFVVIVKSVGNYLIARHLTTLRMDITLKPLKHFQKEDTILRLSQCVAPESSSRSKLIEL